MIPDAPFNTKFRKNRKGAYVGYVPRWWAHIHFDVMLVRVCFLVDKDKEKVELGRTYKVQATSRGAKGTTVKVRLYEKGEFYD